MRIEKKEMWNKRRNDDFPNSEIFIVDFQSDTQYT